MRRVAWLAFVLLAFAWLAPAVAADTVVYYHTDALRSVSVVTDAQGNVLERTRYAPYGQVLNRPLRDGPGYTGHQEDAATGLVYAQQRYYDPETGRFLSVDPVQADPAAVANFNRYWYANNNPYRYTDPDGRCPSCVAALVGGGLELVLQLATPDGRAAYQAAGNSLVRGDVKGAWNAAGANVIKVAASAGAGAVGVGLAGKMAEVANLASKGMEASSASKVATNAAIRIGGNALAGGGLGAASQGVGNVASGQPITSGLGGAAVSGAIGGAVGAGVEIAFTPAAQSLANGTGYFIGSSAGTAAPGSTGPVTAIGERVGAFAGAIAEKATGTAVERSRGCTKQSGSC